LSIEIKILDDKSIGRYFQAAALGYALGTLQGTLHHKLIEGFRDGLIVLNYDEASQLLNSLVSILKIMSSVKKATPTLYRAGKTSDVKLLSMISPQIPLEKPALISEWLIKIGRSILQNADMSIDIPMFLRSYVFSKYRDIGEVKEEKVNIISLYVAIAGALMSILASGLQRGDTRYELYLVPDGTRESLLNSYRIYSILHATGVENFGNYIRGLLSIESLSFELAVMLSMGLNIYNTITQTAGMPPLIGLYNVFEKFRLICVKPGDRPLVIWERPLTLTHIFEGLERRKSPDLLNKLYYCAIHASKHSADVTQACDIVSQCITALFSYFETRSLDMLYSCGAGAVRIADQFRDLCRESIRKGRKDANEVCRAEKDFADLTKYLSRLL
jgi:hypothetical protein